MLLIGDVEGLKVGFLCEGEYNKSNRGVCEPPQCHESLLKRIINYESRFTSPLDFTIMTLIFLGMSDCSNVIFCDFSLGNVYFAISL